MKKSLIILFLSISIFLNSASYGEDQVRSNETLSKKRLHFRIKNLNNLMNFCRKEKIKNCFSITSCKNNNALDCSFSLRNSVDELVREKKYKQAYKLTVNLLFSSSKTLLKYNDLQLIKLHYANMKANGDGIDKDLYMAISLYRDILSSQPGNLKYVVMFNLGLAYYKIRDYISGFHWFHEAAVEGYIGAQSAIAQMYAEGTGVLEDSKKAYAWASIAAAQGLKDASRQADVERLKNTMRYILNAQDPSGKSFKQTQLLAQQYYKIYVLHERPLPKMQEKKKGFVNKLKAISEILQG